MPSERKRNRPSLQKTKAKEKAVHPPAWFKGLAATWFLAVAFLPYPLGALPVGGQIQGNAKDPLGNPVSGASIVLMRHGASIRKTHTGQDGAFSFSQVPAGSYQVRVTAQGFSPAISNLLALRPAQSIHVEVRLQIGLFKQHVVISATGTSVPESQVGASVSVLTRRTLDALDKLDVLDALRFVPGVQVVQESQRGSIASIFIRGGDDDFNKVLLDGIPVNDIGGEFDFSNLSTSGVNEVEVFRGPDSILYGSDALAGVINITTREGSTPTPQFTYSADAGNFETYRQEVSVGGASHRFDYYSNFMRFDTQNGLPNNSFHNATYTGNFGWKPLERTSIRFTIHHDATGLGSSNALALYAIPDDSFQRQQDTDLGLTAEDQPTSRWHNLLRLTSAHIHYNFDTPAPSGIPFSAPGLGTNYLGEPVTICGANGYCASGQGILDYGGAYPMVFNSLTTVRSIYGQTDYAFNPSLGATAGFTYFNETGSSQSSGAAASRITRNNYDGFLESHGNLDRRLFGTAGAGLESNAVFGFAATPRLSVAYYPRLPSGVSGWGHTKLDFNFGTGIKEPSLIDQESSLYALVSQVKGGPDLLERDGVGPIGAERSSNLDAGVEQGFWDERLQLSATYFHERFYDLIDFVPQTALPVLGVPSAVAAETPFGAYLNSDSFRSQGAEADFMARFASNITIQGTYTYFDAVVTRSFSSSALFPTFNPAFRGIAIGVDAPLVGGRPFRRPSNSASFVVMYSRRRFGTSLNAYFAGRSDDSTYLSDPYFGDTMLLPNHNLLAGYQLAGFSGWYRVHPAVTLYTSMSNILDEHYQAAFGYPALPFTFRVGIRFTLGGGSSGHERKSVTK
jgi:vitamin B12 transporter